MATTRLIPLHINKGKTLTQTLKDRVDYIKNDNKTEKGEYISCYECDQRIVEEQFNLSKSIYEKRTGRKRNNDVIAYQIRQAFKPGEITPEEANQVGYETAMRFLKGKNAFIVATHTDKEHIHNHIIFNSVDINAKKKYRNFFNSSFAIQRVSDIICLEHGLSVVKPKKYNEHESRPQYITHSFRVDIRTAIDQVFENKPRDMDEFIELLRKEGYEVKYGKYISVKGKEQKSFIRLRSLGNGYREGDIEKRIAGEIIVDDKYVRRNSKREVDLLVDIQKKLAEGKSGGYEKWAKVYNIKQMAKTIIFLQEHDIRDYKKLESIADGKSEYYNELLSKIKSCEKRMSEIQKIKKAIIDYSKTREVYSNYRMSGYSKKFFEEHRAEIEIHKVAKKVFEEHSGNVPKIAVLNLEYSDLLEQKREAYAEYQQAKKEMQDYQTAKRNVDVFLQDEEKRNKDKSKENEI